MIRILAGAALLTAMLPAAAAAQTQMPAQNGERWFVSPFAGPSFGGDVTHTSGLVGVSGGYRWSSKLAIEAELADAPSLIEQNGFLINRRVTTFMGNAIYGLPSGNMRLKPFVIGGLGLFRPHVTEAGELTSIEGDWFGFNVGGGVAALLSKQVGVRGDLRYVRGTHDAEEQVNLLATDDVSSFGFWRLSAGLIVRF
jgi:opacity protein-like surface antigen